MITNLQLNLKAARLEKGITQSSIAKHLGIDRTSYIRKEGGKQSFTIEEFASAYQYLGYDIKIIK